jgi:outer membrane protein OmpA-like peptidoglycan-associated protein/uncharacterized protein YidB (DUF937 family)
MFDALVREISQRFGLGDKAQELINSLLALIFDPNSGGIQGLLAKAKEQGLADLVSSWLGGSAVLGAAINPHQLDNLLGSSALGGIADKLGIARGTVVAAASAALPKLIGLLTPNGQLPSAVPASVGSLIGDVSAAAAPSVTQVLAATAPAASAVDDAAGGLAWIKWLILAAIILLLGYCVLKPKSAAPPAPTATTTPAAPKPSAAQTAIADAKAALSALVPGKYTVDDLVKALNLMVIHFDTGAASISADSLDVLGAAANAIKAAPAGSKVEVGGHTDNSGDPAANLKLSDDRANAVRVKLTELGVAADQLTAKGYGDTKPVADNATEDGRAKNRRIEFTVQH